MLGYEGSIGRGRTLLEAMTDLAAMVTWTSAAGSACGGVGYTAPADAEHITLGLPFVPYYADGALETDDPDKFIKRFECVNLGADDRCQDYANRPALCRHYQAGDDRLCVEYDRVHAMDVPDTT